jgi:hypothetical protein
MSHPQRSSTVPKDIQGMIHVSAHAMTSETGPKPNTFEDSAALASWCGLCPEAVSEKSRYPSGVGEVGFSSWFLLHVQGIDEQGVKESLRNVVNGCPVWTGTFRGNDRTRMGWETFPQLYQFVGEGSEIGALRYGSCYHRP